MDQISLFAMTKKGYMVLLSLHRRYPHLIHSVISDRDAGIVDDYYEKIKSYCLDNNILFFDRAQKPAIKTKYAFAVSWRWIISNTDFYLITFHDSLLPRYRGFSPLVASLINKEPQIGVTCFYATDEYDKGDIIIQESTQISYPITISEAIEQVIPIYCKLAEYIADLLVQGQHPPSFPQDEGNASYSLWRDEEDYFLDWGKSADYLVRCVDALGYPYKGASSVLRGEVVKIWKASEVEDVHVEIRQPGKVLFIKDGMPIVVCGKGLLRIESLTDSCGRSIIHTISLKTRFKGNYQ